MKKIELPLPALRLLAALGKQATLATAARQVDLSQSAASHALGL